MDQSNKEKANIPMYFTNKKLVSSPTTAQQIPSCRRSYILWREKTQDGYHFFDGDEDFESYNEGCPLFHQTSVLLKGAGKQQRAAWKIILHRGIKLPTPSLYLYEEAGNPGLPIYFSEQSIHY